MLRATVLALVLAVGAAWLAATTVRAWPTASVAAARQSPAGAHRACLGDGPVDTEPTPAADEGFTTGLPSGITFSLLATGLADRLPTPPSRLQLTVVSLKSGAGSDTRQAVGPVLFYVATGTVTFAVEGEPTVLTQGASVVVQADQLYAYGNAAAEPASMLRLGLAPPNSGEIAIATYLTPPPSLEIPTSTAPTGQLLFSADLATAPPVARLFIACLGWQEATADVGEHHHPGPIGLRVERGSLIVGDEGALPETGCAAFEAGQLHSERAGDPLPTVLMFGAIAEGETLWLPATGEAAVAFAGDLNCGEA